MLTAAEEKTIHDKVEALRPIIAAEMTVKARLVRVEESGDHLQMRLKFGGCSPIENMLTMINRGGWQLGQEFEVVLRPVKPDDSVSTNGF